MKKQVIIITLFIITTTLYSQTINDFEKLLQMKAVIVASYGTYKKPNTTNPYDYYTVNTLKQITSSSSELKINTNTFSGVCADYSVRMYNSITDNKALFERMGMKQNQYYIALSAKNSYTGVSLYKISTRNDSYSRMNGVYLKKYMELPVTTHGYNTNHAWIWVQHNNGTWYWIDPTWTDNTGRVAFGTVSNNKEIYKNPVESICVIKNNVTPVTGSYANLYDFYIPSFNIGTFFSFLINNDQNLFALGIDIFGEKNVLGFSFEFLFNMGDSIETYRIIDKYSYETTYYNEYAVYFAVHYSFLKFRDNRTLLGGTLGLGYHEATETGGGSSYSSKGFPPGEFNGMIEDEINLGFAFKIGAYIIYNFDWFSVKSMIEYKSFGGLSIGFGFSILL